MYSFYCRLSLPVWASDADVIRATLGRLTPEGRRLRLHRDARHALLRDVLKVHHRAQNLCKEFRL